MLKGSIDDKLQMRISLEAGDVDNLEQQHFIYGHMLRPVKVSEKKHEPETAKEKPRKKRKKSDLPPPPEGHKYFQLALYLRSDFRMSGIPSHRSYLTMVSYDVYITPEQLSQIRQCNPLRLSYPNAPINIEIALEGSPNGSEPRTQSL